MVEKKEEFYFTCHNVFLFFKFKVLLGLGHLHGCGIIYRDMKLENILVDTDGHVCLADFGLSKILNGADDRATTMCGTPGYVAPEVLLGKGYGTQVPSLSFLDFVER